MRFEVFVNGKKTLIAGIDGFGVLTAILTRVKRNPRRVDLSRLENCTFEQFLEEKVDLQVGGLDSNDQTGEHGQNVVWLKQVLQPGDEVTFRVLPPGQADPPLKNVPRS